MENYYNDLNTVDSKSLYNQLPEYTRIARYAQYNRNKKRRETWEEQTNRVFNMHKVKFAKYLDNKEFMEYFNFAKNSVLNKDVLGSQRALQFGGPSILNKNTRIYNCAATYIDRVKSFQEIMFTLLCGVGIGFSVQTHHIFKLPNIKETQDIQKIYQIPDSIEGWSDSIAVLVSSYFTDNQPFPEYFNYDISFDFSLIRPAGSNISNIGGKAPGPDGLKASLQKIKEVFKNCISIGLNKLRPIDAYDIIVHSSDAVLSGGIRRSATLCLFSLDDTEMIGAKTGDWYIKNPQRARSNNSVLLLRDNTPEEKYMDLITSVKQFGEPGIIWADNTETLYNPCVPSDTWVFTSEGSRQVSDLIGKPFMAVVDGKEYECKTGFIKTGENTQVYKIITKEGFEVKATDNHKILTADKYWVELKDLIVGDKITINDHSDRKLLIDIHSDDFSKGFSKGCLFVKKFSILESRNYSQETTDSIEKSSDDLQAGFLAGCLNNCVIRKVNNEISMSLKYLLFGLKIIQRVALRFGIYSKIYTDQYKYDLEKSKLVIKNSSLHLFLNITKQTNEYKEIRRFYGTNYTATIIDIFAVEKCDVYDCTVDDVHAFDANGLYVHNCVEISLYGYDSQGNSGIQMCNLSEINMSSVNTENDFYDRCKSASILGTFQAAYTDFGYLGKITQDIVEREALIGVSMTGMMENPSIAFNPEILEKGATIVKNINEELAKIIGINKASRTTCIKPAGSTSCILGSSSGIHPCHADRYFRRVQSNNLEDTLKFFKKYNPQAVETSVWSSGKTDDVITFLCKSKPGSLTKVDVSAIDLLEKVKLVQKYWVTTGRNLDVCVQPWLNHNVSNTITIKDTEWELAAKFIYDNRHFFAGISMLGDSGDMTYHQAPFQAVYTHEIIAKMYGAGSVFASGLIVHANDAFNNNLYSACATLLGYGENLKMPDLNEDSKVSLVDSDKIYKKIRWIAQAKKFSKRHFNSDNLKMTYCLKAVDAWKTWCDLKRTYKTVPWEEFFEEQDNTKPTEYVACSGNSCELIKF